jgi:hypothetical protein
MEQQFKTLDVSIQETIQQSTMTGKKFYELGFKYPQFNLDDVNVNIYYSEHGKEVRLSYFNDGVETDRVYHIRDTDSWFENLLMLWKLLKIEISKYSLYLVYERIEYLKKQNIARPFIQKINFKDVCGSTSNYYSTLRKLRPSLSKNFKNVGLFFTNEREQIIMFPNIPIDDFIARLERIQKKIKMFEEKEPKVFGDLQKLQNGEEVDCCVCMESLTLEKIKQNSCGHILCETCHSRCSSCPTCRASLGDRFHYHEFNILD